MATGNAHHRHAHETMEQPVNGLLAEGLILIGACVLALIRREIIVSDRSGKPVYQPRHLRRP